MLKLTNSVSGLFLADSAVPVQPSSTAASSKIEPAEVLPAAPTDVGDAAAANGNGPSLIFWQIFFDCSLKPSHSE